MQTPLYYLKRYWSFDSFREPQLEIIEAFLSGNDVVALLPTGAGKSLCYQLPALMREGITIVISPLVSLMKDQVQALTARGVSSLMVHSGMSTKQIDAALDNAIYGDYKLLYLSPERMGSDLFKMRVANMNVSAIAVDEAHSISQWGHDFRPDYLKIKEIFETIPRVPIIALTATATPTTLQEIIENLDLSSPQVIKSSFERANLTYIPRFTEDKLGSLLRAVKRVDASTIVYVRKRRECEEISKFLNSNGVSADSYHAGYHPELRFQKQSDWSEDRVKVMVATNAFGMGIDKPNVRLVCHTDLPESLERYYQEAGRAGRDGKESYSFLLWDKNDITRLRRLVSLSFPELKEIEKLYHQLYRYHHFEFGEGKGSVVKFDLVSFSVESKIHSLTAHYIIKYLESENILELTEEMEIPSTITFLTTRDELYKVQLNNLELDTFIKSLLRLYTGLFSGNVTIDENYIARATKNSASGVKILLKRLASMGIINYNIESRSTLLIFKEARENNINLSIESYELKRGRFEQRVESVISFINDNKRCRSGALVEYFGQSEWSDCGKCDICRGRAAKRVEWEADIEYEIIATLRGGPITLEELTAHLTNFGEGWQQVLRAMVERNIVQIKGEYLLLTYR